MSGRGSRTNEFSRPVAIESIGPKAQVREIEAGEGERRALAERLGLPAIERLSASIELSRPAGDVVLAKGHLAADVVQNCVVTLEPVPAHLDVDFACRYASDARAEAEVDIDPLTEDEIEAVTGAEIDIGETVAQQLAIALDPYPRAPGAAWPQERQQEPSVDLDERRKPFAGLEKLKRP